MIQELKIKNFLSFRDEVTFSFEATKDKTFQEYQTIEVAKGVRLLRFAVVYGANASGKTNLLNAFNFILDFWFNKRGSLSEKTLSIPFLLDKHTPAEPSIFSLKFYVNGTKYWYQLEVDQDKVHFEKLSYYSSVQPTMLFERTLKENVSNITFNQSVIKMSAVVKDEINVKCLANMSFFAARNQVNATIPEVDTAMYWMQNNFMPIITPNTNLLEYAEKRIQDNDSLIKHLLEFLKKADFNVTNINSNFVEEDIDPGLLKFILDAGKLSVSEKENIRKFKFKEKIKTDFEHTVSNKRGKEAYYLSKELQSKGTQRIFGLETAIYNTIEKKCFLAVDEIESSLHPDLMEYIIQKFLSIKDNKSQLLVTTHYDPLLNEVDDLFRKDCVWFTQKKENGHTELYSLVDFKGLNRIPSKQRAYRNGLFGAIPNIKG